MSHTLVPDGVVIQSPAAAGGVVEAAEAAGAAAVAADAAVAAAGAAAVAVDSSTGLPVPIWSLCASIALIAPLPVASEAPAVGAALGALAGAGAGAMAGAAAGLSSARRGSAASAEDAANTAHRTAREARMAATGARVGRTAAGACAAGAVLLRVDGKGGGARNAVWSVPPRPLHATTAAGTDSARRTTCSRSTMAPFIKLYCRAGMMCPSERRVATASVLQQPPRDREANNSQRCDYFARRFARRSSLPSSS